MQTKRNKTMMEGSVFRQEVDYSHPLRDRYNEITKHKWTPIQELVYDFYDRQFKTIIKEHDTMVEGMKLLPFDFVVIKTKDVDIYCIVVSSKRYSGGLIIIRYIPVRININPIDFVLDAEGNILRLNQNTLKRIIDTCEYYMEKREVYPVDICLICNIYESYYRFRLCKLYESMSNNNKLRIFSSNSKYRENVYPKKEIAILKSHIKDKTTNRSFDPCDVNRVFTDEADSNTGKDASSSSEEHNQLLGLYGSIIINNRPWEMPHHVSQETGVKTDKFSDIILDMCYDEKYDFFITQNKILNNIELSKQFLNDYRSLSFINLARSYPGVDIKDTVQKIINKYKVARN